MRSASALDQLTTISGPPLALTLNNQGLAKSDFSRGDDAHPGCRIHDHRDGLWAARLYTRASLALVPVILPGVVLGVPIGVWLIRRVNPEAFRRRLSMSVDAWIVGIGIAALLPALGLTNVPAALGILAAIVAADVALLYRFFSSGASLTDTSRLLSRG